MEATLRVPTHADDTFRRICLPKLGTSEDSVKVYCVLTVLYCTILYYSVLYYTVKVYEDKLRVRWQPASLERWLTHNQHKDTFIHSFRLYFN